MTTRAQTRPAERSAQIDFIARNLLSRAALLVRLLVKQVPTGDVSRTEVEVLAVLGEGPRRVTELAELEGLAQPTMTVLVKRLEERGWVERARDATDGRVALISLTGLGAATLEQFRAHYRSALAERLQAMSDAELSELDAAAVAIGQL